MILLECVVFYLQFKFKLIKTNLTYLMKKLTEEVFF